MDKKKFWKIIGELFDQEIDVKDEIGSGEMTWTEKETL